MVWEEIKRQLVTRYVLIAMVSILLLTVGLSTMLVRDTPHLKQDMREEAIYSGLMTEEKLWMGLHQVRDHQSEKAQYRPLMTLIRGMVNNYSGVLYGKSRVQDYPDAYAKDFYTCWRNKSKALIDLLAKEQQRALEELDKVRTPFSNYSGSYIWCLGLHYLRVIYLIILFMVTFFAAGVYADSMENGSMPILTATIQGKRNMWVRLMPIILYGTVLTVATTLTMILILGSTTGLETMRSSLKVFALFSLGNHTIGEGILLMVVSELLGILALTVMMGWISLKTGKTSLAIGIGIGIHVLYIILAFFLKSSGRLSQLLTHTLPMASSQVINQVQGYNFYMGLWQPYGVMVSMVVVFGIGVLLLGDGISRCRV